MWLHVLLFATTLFTTTLVGAALARSFEANRPLSLDADLAILFEVRANPGILLTGLPFAATFLGILLAHEMGHYLTCLRYGINASLPYFLPAPTLIGTLGAFIRIRSPIYTRRALFDVGIAGPLAGFALLVPALMAGVLFSRVVPGVGNTGDFVFGTPLILRFFELIVFPHLRAADISLHPVARAAWAGLLATALNLLPIGQLDGGHILYALFGKKHRLLSRLAIAALIPLGFLYYWGWLLWAVLLSIFGLRHPPIVDDDEVGRTRKLLGWVALAIFVLSFAPAPVRAN